MRSVFFAALLGLVSTPLAAQEASLPCSFAIVQPAPRPVAKAREDLMSRLRVIHQPGSPVVVTAVDLSSVELNASSTSYTWRGSYQIELLNVSDQPVRDVRLWVMTRWASGSGGGGHGVNSVEAIAPGERFLLTSKGGSGQGSTPRDDHLFVDVFVDSVKLRHCTYRPTQIIPSAF